MIESLVNENIKSKHKIGLVTLFGDNYGNKLQNYALQTLLEKYGYTVETIIIKNGNDIHWNESFKEKLVKFKPKYIISYINQLIRNKFENRVINRNYDLIKTRTGKFRLFTEKYIHLSDFSIDADKEIQDEILEEYKYFVTGSDQVWNRTKSPYFLTFAPENRRIAFAPSFGLSHIPNPLHVIYRKWLKEIPYLSVREEQGAVIIKELIGRDVPVLPDPTLCLSKEDWMMVEKEPPFDTSSYVLSYFLGSETDKYRRYIKTYAQKNGFHIINLLNLQEPEHYSVDPAEFVWLIHHAKMMFTDSFHGTVFSLIFHTPFLVFDRVENGGTSMGSRIDTLLKMSGLSQRRYGKIVINKLNNVEFSASEHIIHEKVQSAYNFLKDIFNKTNNAATHLSQKNTQRFVHIDKRNCSGCGACMFACPAKSIQMKMDDEGFAYPTIDSESCIHCGRCIKMCESAAKTLANGGEEAYLAYIRDNKIRNESSSGGMFSALAGRFLDAGGYVYGASFDDKFQIIHRSVSSCKELEQLRGSKYVQSNLSNSFIEIRQRLENGERIYFSGTPCQVNGLIAYLGKKYENLVTQDIICHGVASPKVWQEYLELRAKGSNIEKVSFRDKSYGWHYFSMKIKTTNRNYTKRLDEDVFLRLFLDNIILRPACYACKHKHTHRKADLTLADAWSLQKFNTTLKDDDHGISLVFANTDKGKKLLSELFDCINSVEVPFEEAIKSQSAMTNSVQPTNDRELFFSMVKENGVKEAIIQWYGFDLFNMFNHKFVYFKTQAKKILCRMN